MGTARDTAECPALAWLSYCNLSINCRNGSGGATSFIAPIPSACRRFRPASSRRDETLCNGLHSCAPVGQGHTRPPRPRPRERSATDRLSGKRSRKCVIANELRMYQPAGAEGGRLRLLMVRNGRVHGDQQSRSIRSDFVRARGVRSQFEREPCECTGKG